MNAEVGVVMMIEDYARDRMMRVMRVIMTVVTCREINCGRVVRAVNAATRLKPTCH